MANDKPKLQLFEIKQLIDRCRGGGYYSMEFHGYQYTLDDVYNHIVSYHDIMMSLMDEIILKKQRL